VGRHVFVISTEDFETDGIPDGICVVGDGLGTVVVCTSGERLESINLVLT